MIYRNNQHNQTYQDTLGMLPGCHESCLRAAKRRDWHVEGVIVGDEVDTSVNSKRTLSRVQTLSYQIRVGFLQEAIAHVERTETEFCVKFHSRRLFPSPWDCVQRLRDRRTPHHACDVAHAVAVGQL